MIKKLQRLIFVLIAILINQSLYSQCDLGNPFSIGDQAQTQTCGTTAETAEFLTLHSSCIYAGEFGSMEGAVIGNTYCFFTSTNDFLTVYNASDTTVVATGSPEVCVLASDSILYIQMNLNTYPDSCETENNCRSLFSFCQDCPISTIGCTDPLALNFNSCAITDNGSCEFSSCSGFMPENDLCANATPLTINTNTCIAPTIGNADCATDGGDFSVCSSIPYYFSNDIPYTGYSTNQDVWYTFVVPQSGNVTINLNAIFNYDGYCNFSPPMYYSILSGTCGNFNELDCGSIFNSAQANVFTFTPGDVIYIRVWTAVNDYYYYYYYAEDYGYYNNYCPADFGVCVVENFSDCSYVDYLTGVVSQGIYLASSVLSSNGQTFMSDTVQYYAGDTIILESGFIGSESFSAEIENFCEVLY